VHGEAPATRGLTATAAESDRASVVVASHRGRPSVARYPTTSDARPVLSSVERQMSGLCWLDAGLVLG
jgi:hypothetical protein